MTESSQVDRRAFILNTSGVLTGMLTLGGPLAALAPSRSWAVDLVALTSAEAATLLVMARTIAPHDRLEDAAYALVVRAVDADASKSPATLDVLRKGIVQLGAGFAHAPEAARVDSLKKLEHTPFFELLRGQTLQVLYATPMAYALFGYEGEAFSKGGYLLRGFDDLRWLPDVPQTDGGPRPGQSERS
jgi:hypothetical protein